MIRKGRALVGSSSGDETPDLAGAQHEHPEGHLLLRPGPEERRAPGHEARRGEQEDLQERRTAQPEGRDGEADRRQDQGRGRPGRSAGGPAAPGVPRACRGW